jgi:uncharacterized membrane protein (DUF485 family)
VACPFVAPWRPFVARVRATCRSMRPLVAPRPHEPPGYRRRPPNVTPVTPPGRPKEFAVSETADTPRAGLSAEDYERVQASPEFQELKRRFRNFAFPMTAAFIAWYLLYVLLSTYAVDFMSTPVIGNINIGLLLGLGQFVSTFLITWLYIRHADRKLDPIASKIRGEMEEGMF